jgi:hypothetical protein
MTTSRRGKISVVWRTDSAGLVGLVTYIGSRQAPPQQINATINGSAQLVPPAASAPAPK